MNRRSFTDRFLGFAEEPTDDEDIRLRKRVAQVMPRAQQEIVDIGNRVRGPQRPVPVPGQLQPNDASSPGAKRAAVERRADRERAAFEPFTPAIRGKLKLAINHQQQHGFDALRAGYAATGGNALHDEPIPAARGRPCILPGASARPASRTDTLHRHAPPHPESVARRAWGLTAARQVGGGKSLRRQGIAPPFHPCRNHERALGHAIEPEIRELARPLEKADHERDCSNRTRHFAYLFFPNSR